MVYHDNDDDNVVVTVITKARNIYGTIMYVDILKKYHTKYQNDD